MVGVIALGVPTSCAPPGDTPSTADSATRRDSVASPAASALDSSARAVLAFLRDSLPFERLALADSVTFYVAPEGGGGRATVARTALRQPSAWVVKSQGRAVSLLPPRMSSPEIKTVVGRHLNCQESELATRMPALASAPHVGTMLQPRGAGSCLQAWNVTFVFDTTRGAPRLIAAVYDQWEW